MTFTTASFNGHQHIRQVSNFEDLVSLPFSGDVNAMCWSRELLGDFSEIIDKLQLTGNVTEVESEELNALLLTEQGQLAREILLQDLKLLEEQGASPVLNVIKNYDRDDAFPFFSTDVYSFHADRSPVPTETFLCTYYGAPSELVPNAQAEQKILIPEIREQLKRMFDGPDEEFEAFLSEQCFDLHYQEKPDASIISLGLGNLWKLAVEHPESPVLPCIHRAPIEQPGQARLLLIC
ncbi:MAG: hypothetical protein V4616_09130 [Bacteroidota bacterium]